MLGQREATACGYEANELATMRHLEEPLTSDWVCSSQASSHAPLRVQKQHQRSELISCAEDLNNSGPASPPALRSRRVITCLSQFIQRLAETLETVSREACENLRD
ncbi:hypothetical protein MHYP_G00315000 [Metynnis hypsauchen]